MEWMGSVLPVIGLLIVVSPLIMLLLTVFLLMPLALLASPAPTLSRASFNCPFSKRRANVAFLNSPDAGQPTDVLTCSVFSDARGIRCAKGCLELATTRPTPSPVFARYALLADGEARPGVA